METIVVALHIFICLFLIGVILLQPGKSGDISAIFTGGTQSLFGGRGPVTFLSKLTIVISIIFLFTSIWLAKIGFEKESESVIGKVPVEEVAPAPLEEAPIKK